MKKYFLFPLIFTSIMQAQQTPQEAFAFVQVIPCLESLAASAIDPKDIEVHYRTSQSTWRYPLRNFAEELQIKQNSNESFEKALGRIITFALEKNNYETLSLLFFRVANIITTNEKLNLIHHILDKIVRTPQKTSPVYTNTHCTFAENILARSQGIPNNRLNELLMEAYCYKDADIINLVLSYMHHKKEPVTAFYDQWNDFPLHKSIIDGSINRLIENDAIGEDLLKAINQQDSSDEETPLHLAVKYSSPSVIQFFLNHKATIESQNHYKESPLITAFKYNRLKIAWLLIDNGANVNSEEFHHRWSPLHFSCNSEMIGLTKRLIEKGADINCKDRYGRTPLYRASLHENKNLLKILIDVKADINSKDSYGRTPLHNACKNNQIEIAQFLIENGADINSENYNLITPFETAYKNNYIGIMKLLINSGFNVNTQSKSHPYWTPLQRAYSDNNLEIIDLLIKSEADVNTNPSLLYLSCLNDTSKEIIELLLNSGADIQRKEGYDESTPLHLICKRKNVAAAQTLLEKGADVNSKDKQGDTPLHLACRNINSNLMKLLINSGADLNSKNNHGIEPLQLLDRNQPS